MFDSVTINNGLYTIADTFTFELAGWMTISAGTWCDISIDGVRVMRGVMTKSERSKSKTGGHATTVSGIDLCGVLDMCQSQHYHVYHAEKPADLITVANDLCEGLEWRKQLSFRIDGTPEKKRVKFVVEPGQSIAGRLADLAAMRGLIMWADPDGTIVFGSVGKKKTLAGTITVGEDLVISYALTESIEGGASRVVVIVHNADKTTKASGTVPEFPIDIPAAIVLDSDSETPAPLLKRKITEVSGKLISGSATMAGLGKFSIGDVIRFVDTSDAVDREFLISDRECQISKTGGTTTMYTFAAVPQN